MKAQTLRSHKTKYIHPLKKIIFISDKKADFKTMTSLLYSMFSHSQYPNATNLDFGRKSIKESFKDLSNQYKKKAMVIINSMEGENLDYLFSREHLTKERGSDARSCLFEALDIDRRIGRIIRDGVDNRLERRRELLTDFILDNIEDYHSYDSLLNYAKENVELYQQMLYLFGSNESSQVKKALENNVSRHQLILRLVLSERNFIERYLREGRK